MSGLFAPLEMPPSLPSMAESAAQMDTDWRTHVPEHVRTWFITRLSQELSRITGDNDREKTWRAASKFEIKHWSTSASQTTYMATMVRKLDSLQKGSTDSVRASPLSDEIDLDGIEDFVLPPPVVQHTLLQQIEGDASVPQQQQLRETQRLETIQLLQRQLREQYTLVQSHHLKWVSLDECFTQLRLLQQRHEAERSQRQQNHVQQQSTTAPAVADNDSSHTLVDRSSTDTATTSVAEDKGAGRQGGGATAKAAVYGNKAKLAETQKQRLTLQLTKLREQQQEIAVQQARATAPDLQAKLAQQAEKIAQLIDKISHHFPIVAEDHERAQSEVGGAAIVTTAPAPAAAVVDASQTPEDAESQRGGATAAADADVVTVDASIAPADEEENRIISMATREKMTAKLTTTGMQQQQEHQQAVAGLVAGMATHQPQQQHQQQQKANAGSVAGTATTAALTLTPHQQWLQRLEVQFEVHQQEILLEHVQETAQLHLQQFHQKHQLEYTQQAQGTTPDQRREQLHQLHQQHELARQRLLQRQQDRLQQLQHKQQLYLEKQQQKQIHPSDVAAATTATVAPQQHSTTAPVEEETGTSHTLVDASTTDAATSAVADGEDAQSQRGGATAAATAEVVTVDAPPTAPATTEEGSPIVSMAMRENAAKALSAVLLRVKPMAGRDNALVAATEFEQWMWSSHADKVAYRTTIWARIMALMQTAETNQYTLRELLTMPAEQLPKWTWITPRSIPSIGGRVLHALQPPLQDLQLALERQQQQQQQLELLRPHQQQRQQGQPQAVAKPARPITLPPIRDGFQASRDTYGSSSVWTNPAWLSLVNKGQALSVRLGSLLTQREHSEVWRSACGQYALKRLRGIPAMTDVAAFVTRVSMLSSLTSDIVVKPVAALGSSALTLRVVTAYAERGNLRSLLLRSTGDNSSSELNWAEDKSVIALDVAEALAYLHSSGSSEDAKTKTKAVVVVGDLHAGHVLVDSDGHARVNLVQFSASSANVGSEKQEGDFPYWRSPEVLQGSVATTASDMYAFGVLLCELDTGVVPYSEAFDAGFEPADVQAGVVSGELRPSVSDACPPRIEQLAIECMVAEAAARPSAAQVVYRLRDILKNDL